MLTGTWPGALPLTQILSHIFLTNWLEIYLTKLYLPLMPMPIEEYFLNQNFRTSS